jgi:hypothetical protein
MIVLLGIVFRPCLDRNVCKSCMEHHRVHHVSNRDVWAMMHVDQKPNGMHLESQFRHKESESETQKIKEKA